MKRRVLACLTALVMAINMIPSSALAVQAGETEQPAAVEETVPEEEEESVQDSGGSDSEEQAVEDSSDGGGETSEMEETASEETASDQEEEAEEASAEEKEAVESEEPAAGEEAAESDEPAVEEEVEYFEGTLSYQPKDKNYQVKVECGKDAKIPAGAELKVEEIKKDSDEYQDYLDEAAEAVEKEVAEARFFDISIWADGQEVTLSDSVKVSITYKKGIEVDEESNGKVTAIHFDEEKDEPEVLDTETNAGSKVKKIEFEAESFSVYGVVYTVDFTYDGFTYSIEGESEILLSELAEKLDLYSKGFVLADVIDVTFSNDALLEITKQDGDWLLKSLQAFSTTETLTIIMANGDKYVIDVTDAVNALTVKVNLYDYADATTMAFPTDFSEDNIYVFAYVDTPGTDFKDLPSNTPWSVMDANRLKGLDSPYTVEIPSFSKNDSWFDGNTSYASLSDTEKSNLKVRVIHKDGGAPTFGDLKGMAQWQTSSFEELWNGGFDGYEISKAHASGLISTGNYEVNFKQGNTKELDVTLKFNPASDKGPIAGGKYYVMLDATSADGNNHYYYVVEAAADGTEDTVNIPITGNWSGGQPFSNNWQNIKTTVITPKAGKTITPGNNKPADADYDVSYMIGDYLAAYKDRETETDETNHIQHDEFVIELKKANFDAAIDPYDVLGEGAEYGVIANEYERKEHTETNFAVNKYFENTGAGIDLAANGGESEGMPYYIGEYNHIKFTGNTTVNPDIYTPSTSTSPYVHTKNNSEEETGLTDHIHQDGSGYDITVIPTPKADVKRYVDGLIGKLTSSSETYAGKTTIKADPGTVLDTTSLPDNITIYVDATDLNIGETGWEIKKLEGQSIVINKPGANVPISKEYVSVYKKNNDGSLTTIVNKLNSNTDGNGGNAEHNNAVENHILNHIVINAYEATSVTFTNGPAGLFLAPNANFEEVNGSGTGWVATGKKFTQTGAEWHFFRTQRRYKAEGDFSLNGQKKIVDTKGNVQDYSEFKSMEFSFDLFACDASGNVAEGATPIETATAGGDGTFKFSTINYTQTDVPQGTSKTFYYVIKEKKPSGTNNSSVNYNAPDVYVKVKATDDGAGVINLLVSKGTSLDSLETVNATNKAYDIGGFENTLKNGSLKVKKIVNGDDAKESYEIAVKDSNGHYYDVDGTDKGTAPFYVTFAKDQVQTWQNLPRGTYTVEEKDASADGYNWTVSGTGDVAVKANETAAANVTNTYVKHAEGEIKAKKNFTGRAWKAGDSFEFTLAPANGGPMPEGTTNNAKKITVTSADAVSFGKITFSTEGTYKYTITETKGNLPGVTYNTTPQEVTVTVTKNETTNALKATVTYAEGTDAQVITNEFKAVKEHVEVTKSINNWGTAESFKFTLSAKDPTDAPMPAESGRTATATKTDTTAVFGDITFEAPGTYVYAIKETDDHVPGITYDTSEHLVTVVVSQNNETNELSATVTYGTDAASLTITNEFKTVEATLEATKSINDWGSAESFTFKLAPVDGAPMPGNAEEISKTVTKDGNLKAVFGSIEYDTVGQYKYKITEVNDGVPGVTYDTAEHLVVVDVHKADDSNDLEADVTYDGQTSLTITNRYASANLTLRATKAINEWGDAESFTFNLAPGKSMVNGKEGTSPMPEKAQAVATKDAMTASFGSVKYEEAGTYNYTITEVDDHVAGITYDTTPHNVVVTVERDDNGNLVAFAKYDGQDSLTITNTFTSIKKQFEVTKAIEDWGRATSFTFKLAAETENAPVPASDTVTVTKGGSMKAVFGEIEYKTTGEYDYTITEQNDHVDGVTYDTTPHRVHVSVTMNDETNALEATVTYDDKESLTITNTFTAAEAELKATKSFNDWGKANEFNFELEAVSAVDATDDQNAISPIPVPEEMTAKATSSNKTASFGKIKYDQAGTYTYTITEQNGGVDGVSYDTTPHIAVVTVTKDPDTNALTASVKYDEKQDDLTISNTYESTKATIEAEKNFADWGKADSFTFNLAAVTENAPMPLDDEGNVVNEATATEETPLASFGSIVYEKAGVYKYTITERNDHVDGVTYDTAAHSVVVTVTKANNSTNKLSASVKYDDAESLKITNTYTSVKKELEATKLLSDWGTVDSFTFTLKAEGGAPMPADAEDGKKSVDVTQNAPLAKFGDIVYEKAGTYEYTITEEKGDEDGVTYDTTPHTAVVTVTKDPDTNALSVSVKYDGADALTITNKYASANVELQATKNFADWGKADSFTFTLEAASENAPMPEGTSEGKKVVTVTEEGAVAQFGSITYKKTGTYEYTITETDDGKDGVTYDTTPHKVVVTVTKDENNKLVAEAKYDDKESLTITNTYEATKATIEATKAFDAWGKADSFTFQLKAVEGAPMPAGVNEETGIVTATATKEAPLASFGEIEYEKAGTYEYTITEQNDGADGVTYDTEPHSVVVTVTKGEGNKLSAAVKYDNKDSLTITNTYASTKATIEATKSFKDWGKADSFTFKLAAVTENAPMPASDTAIATKDVPLASFGEIEYEKAGTYEYTITEQNGGADGVTYDTTPHKVVVTVTKAKDATNKLTAAVSYDGADSLTITNTYASTKATIEATKDFADWGKADSFTFELAAVTEKAPMPASNTATATKDATLASFGQIEYEKAGTYEYTITEQNDGADGVTYDTTPHKVVVTVTKAEDATNKLTASVKYDDADSLTIKNTYASTSAELQATKDFNDWSKAESFTFELKAVDGAPMPAGVNEETGIVTATATKDAIDAKFGQITFEKAGTYNYTITEVNDGVDGVTYDTTPHKAVVTVTKEEGTNKLSASVKYDDKDSLIITNTFASASVTLQATKSFADWGKADSFTFNLAAVTKDAPMPGKEQAVATKDAPTAVFGSVTYDKAGTYEYAITEVNDGADGVTYDTAPHKAVVTVVKGEDNKLTATVAYDGDKNLIITNTYESTKATIEATKEFADWGKADSFTFKLAAVSEDAPMPASDTATATKDATLASFGEIEYEKAGTYEYTITEQNGGADGVTYDTIPHKVVVTVTKAEDATNKLTASVKYDDADSLTITNTYKATNAELKATKEFEDWGKADSFTFQLAAVTENAPMPASDTASATEADPVASFGKIRYEKAGTYEYTITEVNGGADGVTYDTTDHKVVVTVSKEEGTNKLSASVKYDNKDSLIITNTYASTKAPIEVTKDFNDWGKAESFTFNLAAVTEDAPMPASDTATATKDKTLASFGEIEYEKAGTYEYTITEVNDGADGVTYDTAPHSVVVTVTKEEGTNKLSASVKYDGADSLTITNTYASTSAELQATKDFNDWGKADSFTFELKAVDGAPLPAAADEETGVVTATATKDAVDAKFGEIEYEKAGTYEYTITEVDDGVDGVTYDTTSHKAVVTVTKEEGTNKLSAEVKYDDKDKLIITNTFASASVTLQATKNFADWGKADSFTFDLAAVTKDAPMPEKDQAVATKDAATAVFGSVTYDKAGTYEYTITEKDDGADGVTYDTKAHKAVVTVVKGDDNELTATVAYDGEKSLIITNTYASTKATIEATKEFNDWGKADSFTFKLAAVSADAPMPVSDTATATKDAAKASFGEIEYEKAGTYEYTITEVNGGADGVTYDTTPHSVVVTVEKGKGNKLSASVKYDGAGSLTITNTYASTSAELKATKEINEWGKAESFTFELAAVTEGAPMPGKTTAKATKKAPEASFGNITFEKAGTYEYTITEQDGGAGGVTYDTTPHKVVVTVSKEDGTNKLNAEVKYDGKDSLTITNTYKAEGSVVLEALKELTGETGRVLKPEQFSFELYEGGELKQTKKNGDGGKITFDAIKYTKEGTYTYTIKEVIETKNGYTFDTAEKRVTVTVVDNGDGTMTATPVYDGGAAVFTNTYEASGSASLKAFKTLENRTLEDKQFIFELVNDKTGVPMHTVYNDANGNIVFPAISYKKPGTYNYTIREVVKNEKGYIYDKSEKKAVVTVIDLDEGILATTVEYDGSEQIPEFVNKYEASVSVKKTDVANGEELEGATIQIIDESGKVVDEWVSTKKAHETTGLKTGTTYTLHETVAPDGYTIAADTKFTIDEFGKVTSEGTITQDGILLVEDTITNVKVSKTDIASGEELEGATIQIIDKDDKVVEEWVSTKEAHEVKGLKTGEEYTLHETVAPDGYTLASDTKFTVDETARPTLPAARNWKARPSRSSTRTARS